MHIHTTASDGKKPLEELIPIAERELLGGFCLTDHDTMKAAAKAHICSTPRIEVIPGIELSCKLEGKYLIELIGYFINPLDEEKLKECCDINKEFREARMRKMIWKFNEMFKKDLKDSARKLDLLDWEITYDEVERAAGKEADSIGSNHFNQILINRGLSEGRNAFKTVLNKRYEKSCYVERDAIEIDQASEGIRSNGGVPGMAHPALVAADYEGEITDEDLINMLKPYFGKEIRVIEVDYPYCKVRPECKKLLVYKDKKYGGVAEEYDLIPVNGSDGHQKPDGPALGERRTNRRYVEMIRKLASNKNILVCN